MIGIKGFIFTLIMYTTFNKLLVNAAAFIELEKHPIIQISKDKELIMNTYKSPIEYYSTFLSNVEDDFNYFNNIEWESRTEARREAFFSTVTEPYTYGSGDYARTYVPKAMDARVYEIGCMIGDKFGLPAYELCFLNYYEGPRQALGYHADDAESIDHTRPIAVISLGAEREIWTKPINGSNEDVEKILLNNGSLFIMKAGMQQTHLHRIPKHDRECGPRISLTYRGLKI